MRAGVERLLTALDLHDVMLVGESMGAVLALTTAADLPDRILRVVAVNTCDFPAGIARSSPVIAGVLIGRHASDDAAQPGPIMAGNATSWAE